MGTGIKFYQSLMYALMLHASVFAGFYFSHFEAKKITTPKFVTVGFASESLPEQFTDEAAKESITPESETAPKTQKLADSTNIVKGKKQPKTYLEHLQFSVQEASYVPESARSNNISGNAILRISFKRDGSIINYRLIQKSGYKILDSAAIHTGEKLLTKHFPPAPHNFDLGQNILTYDFPISFDSTENI